MVRGVGRVVRVAPGDFGQQPVKCIEQVEIGARIEVGRRNGCGSVQYAYRNEAAGTSRKLGLDMVGNIDDLAFIASLDAEGHWAGCIGHMIMWLVSTLGGYLQPYIGVGSGDMLGTGLADGVGLGVCVGVGTGDGVGVWRGKARGA